MEGKKGGGGFVMKGSFVNEMDGFTEFVPADAVQVFQSPMDRAN